jgi:hypothetical protein
VSYFPTIDFGVGVEDRSAGRYPLLVSGVLTSVSGTPA